MFQLLIGMFPVENPIDDVDCGAEKDLNSKEVTVHQKMELSSVLVHLAQNEN